MISELSDAGLGGHRAEDGDDRRVLFGGAPHGFESAGKEEGPDDQRRRLIGRIRGEVNTTLHGATDAKRRPLTFFTSAGQVWDCTGAAVLLRDLPATEWLTADLGVPSRMGHLAESLAGRPSATTNGTVSAATRSRSGSAG